MSTKEHNMVASRDKRNAPIGSKHDPISSIEQPNNVIGTIDSTATSEKEPESKSTATSRSQWHRRFARFSPAIGSDESEEERVRLGSFRTGSAQDERSCRQATTAAATSLASRRRR